MYFNRRPFSSNLFSAVMTDLVKIYRDQGRSQNYIKGGPKFSRPLLSRDTDSLSGKTLGHQRKRAPSGI